MSPESSRGDSVAVLGWTNLSTFGIGYLTGEACAFGQRVLCDLNEEGQQLLGEYLGLPDPVFAPPMNSSVNGRPALGCIMLARNSWRDVARFAFFNSGALAFYEQDDDRGELIGLYCQDLVQRFRELGVGSVRVSPRAPAPGVQVGSRNVHQMTGRVL